MVKMVETDDEFMALKKGDKPVRTACQPTALRHVLFSTASPKTLHLYGEPALLDLLPLKTHNPTTLIRDGSGGAKTQRAWLPQGSTGEFVNRHREASRGSRQRRIGTNNDHHNCRPNPTAPPLHPTPSLICPAPSLTRAPPLPRLRCIRSWWTSPRHGAARAR